MKKATAELKAIGQARGSHLMDLHGIGPVVAAPVLADVGDVARFADRNRFAWTEQHPWTPPRGSGTGTVSREPATAASTTIHIVAVTQLRLDTDGRAYYRRKRAEGKKPLEAMRCLSEGSPTPSIRSSLPTLPGPEPRRR